MQVIPLTDLPSQTVNVQLDGQACRIDVYVKSTGVFANLFFRDALVIGGVICQNLNRLVRSGYLGFAGDLMFCDTQGTSDPSQPGIGSRFALVYLQASDVA